MTYAPAPRRLLAVLLLLVTTGVAVTPARAGQPAAGADPQAAGAGPAPSPAAGSRPDRSAAHQRVMPWLARGKITDYVQLGNTLIHADTLETVSSTWLSIPAAPVANLPGQFWRADSNHDLSQPPYGAYLARNVQTHAPGPAPVAPLQGLGGQAWASADLSRYVVLKEGDLFAGRIDWQNNTVAGEKNLTNLGLLDDLKPIAWCGRNFFFFYPRATDKPILKIDTRSGEIAELAETRSLHANVLGSPDGRFLFASDGATRYSAAGAESRLHVFDCISGESFSLNATVDERIYVGTQKQPPKPVNVTVQAWQGPHRFRAGGPGSLGWYDLAARTRIAFNDLADIRRALPYTLVFGNRRQDANIPGQRFLDITFQGFLQKNPPSGTRWTVKRFRVDRQTGSAVVLPANEQLPAFNDGTVTWVDENRYLYLRSRGSLSEVGTWLHDVSSGEQRRLTPFFADQRVWAENATFTSEAQARWSTPLYATNHYLVLAERGRVLFTATRGNVQELISVSLTGEALERRVLRRPLDGVRMRRVHPYPVTLPREDRAKVVPVAPAVAAPAAADARHKVSARTVAPSADGAATAPDPETAGVLENCYADPRLRTRYDCGCVAGRFARERQAQPETGQDGLLAVVLQDTACLNLPEIRRSEYASCFKNPMLNTGGRDREAFCQCYGERVAAVMGEHQGTLSPSVHSRAVGLAIASCRRG